MLKRSLIALAVVALLAVGAQAGTIKSHTWPCTFTYLEITSIPVLMDVGYYINIKDQGNLKIKLIQSETDSKTFEGCKNMTVETNFKAQFQVSITGNGVVGGDFSASVDPSVIEIGTATVKVCAKLVKANLAGAPANTKDVQVATVKVKVRPFQE